LRSFSPAFSKQAAYDQLKLLCLSIKAGKLPAQGAPIRLIFLRVLSNTDIFRQLISLMNYYEIS